MKNTVFLFLLFTIFLFSFSKDNSKKIEAKLVDIQFYSVSNCNIDNPIYVRIIYDVDYKDLKSLKMKHSFDEDISITTPVTETDKKGNIVYGFCSSKNNNKSFTTTFISKKGNESNDVSVTIDFSIAEIITGTAPQIISVN